MVVTGDTSRSDTSNLLVSPVTATAQTQPQPHATLLRTLEQHQGAINYFSRALNANQGLGVGTHWDVICNGTRRVLPGRGDDSDASVIRDRAAYTQASSGRR